MSPKKKEEAAAMSNISVSFLSLKHEKLPKMKFYYQPVNEHDIGTT